MKFIIMSLATNNVLDNLVYFFYYSLRKLFSCSDHEKKMIDVARI